MKFNRKIFFTKFKELLLDGKTLQQDLVDELNRFLDSLEKDNLIKIVPHAAYVMATTWHETAFTFTTIKERGGRDYFVRNYWNKVKVRKQLGNLSEKDAYTYFGRSFVQLTGRNNYTKMTVALKRYYPELVSRFESRTGQTFDLVKYPDQALDYELAYAIISYGMWAGIFTGVGLRKYLSDTKNEFKDYKAARAIVNGKDKDDEIALYAIEFEKVLNSALIKDDVKIVKEPEVPKIEVKEVDKIIVTDDPEIVKEEPVKGQNPEEPATKIEPNTPASPTGWATWTTTVRGWWGSLGLGGGAFSLAKLGEYNQWFTPETVQLLLGITYWGIIFAGTFGVLYFISRQVEKYYNAKNATLLTIEEMKIKANPNLYNVEVKKEEPILEPESDKNLSNPK